MVCGGSFAIIRDRWVSQERNHSLRVKDSKNGDERFDCHGYVSSMFWENSSSLSKVVTGIVRVRAVFIVKIKINVWKYIMTDHHHGPGHILEGKTGPP